MDFSLITALIIFITTFYFIITEKIPRSVAAVIGGAAVVFFRIIDEHEALHAIGINLEIIFLLMGLMIIVNIMSETGIFQWVAIKMAQVARGEPVKIMVLLGIASAGASAFLDNVTTILLIFPISILIAEELKIDSLPFLLTEIFAVNLGGAATLVGDPPNLIIGSKADFGFNDFLLNMGPLVIINMIVFILTMIFFFRKKLVVSRVLKAKVMEMDADRVIKDRVLLNKSLTVFSLVIIGFITNVFTHFGLAVISISGAVALVLITKKDPEHIYSQIEWPTLFFFAGLFIIVDALAATGIISSVGMEIVKLTRGNIKYTAIFTVLSSTALAPILGAIPYTISFVKVLGELTTHLPGNTDPLWWALSMGACFGGNMTLIGSAANVVGASMAEKAGTPISFMKFFRYGVVVTLQSTILSLIYLILRYF